MKSFSVLAALVAVASADESVLRKFEKFRSTHNIDYADSKEELQRLKNFLKNLEILEAVQKSDAGAEYSYLSPLMDKSEEELQKMNGFRKDMAPEWDSIPEHELLPTDNLPDNFDWRDQGAVQEVKNQGQCGSCWAFATVASIEGAYYVNNNKKKKLLSLSEQELVECDSKDNGCGGGLPSNAYQWMLDSKNGLETESDYPYRGMFHLPWCKKKADKEKVFVKSWSKISTDEDQMRAALMKYGPMAIGINAGPIMYYNGGVAEPSNCPASGIDHGVTLVGFGTDKESGKPYWTVKNSWGGAWGEKGYFRIIRNKGACGMNTMVTSVTVDTSKSSDDEDLVWV